MSTENGANEKKGATIASVVIRNFRRLTFGEAKLIPETGFVRVAGPNASGKTSFIKGIMGCFGGKSEVDPGSLHDGSDKGGTTLLLTNGYTLERRASEANPKGAFVLIGPDGGRHGQGKVDSWLGDKSFDPLALFSLSPERMRDVLFSVGKDPDLPEKLDEVRAEYAKVYKKRTPVISDQRHFSGVKEPEWERPEPVDTSAEVARLAELQAHERELGDANRKAHDAQHGVSAAKRSSDTCLAERNRLQDLLSDADAAYVEAQAAIETARAVANGAQRFAEKLPDPTEAMEGVQARLAAAGEINNSIAPWTRYDEAQDELEELKARESALTSELGALKQREADLLDKAGIPVKGLSFGDDGEPLLKGRSIALASGRERVDMAVDVAIASDPEVRVCLLDEEANGLDREACERLNQRAVQADFQIWGCRVDDESHAEVVVRDGVAMDAGALEEVGAR